MVQLTVFYWTSQLLPLRDANPYTSTFKYWRWLYQTLAGSLNSNQEQLIPSICIKVDAELFL
jgi:hypothetical protein